jgi:trk system potassium uptake protein TrkA
MKVIVCGAGQVGYSIAAYMAEENNNVTIIDQDPSLIARVNDELDVSGLVGHAPNPDTLNLAGANEADLLIAVTRSDEVNMMACQIGHSLFGIPKKIARIRNQSYLKPEWSNLFSRTHMPIDVIISPENIIAEDIYSRLSVPGTTYATTLAQGAIHLIGLVCAEDCPLVNTSLEEIETLFPDLNFRIVEILRRGVPMTAREGSHIEKNDEVFVVVDAQHLKRTMQAFGFVSEKARRIVIAGGGNVGTELTKLLNKRGRGEQIKLIEDNMDRARYLSENGCNAVVLHGSALEKDILEQASISRVDTFIATTNHDETNILSSLLAKQYGAKRSITLVSNPAYSPLVGPLGVDAMISPRALLVASVMRHIRRGRIQHIHNLRHGFAEVIEAEVSESAMIANTPLGELDLPDNVIIAAIYRDDKVILPKEDDTIRVNDWVIILAPQVHAHIIEKLFSIHVDIF